METFIPIYRIKFILKEKIKSVLDNFYLKTTFLKKIKPINSCKKVIWLAEVGSREFVPRLSQAYELWLKYKVPSIVMHKHFLSKLNSKDFKETLLIDKSGTLKCKNRLRYCKLRGSLVAIIPEELIVVNNNISLISAALHKNSLAYTDYIFGGKDKVLDYVSDKKVKNIDCINPRFNFREIDNFQSKFGIETTGLGNNNYILINDSTCFEYSSFLNEEDLIRELFKNTKKSAKNYLKNIKKEELIAKEDLVKLIHELINNKIFDNFDIVIRPHPSVDLLKYRDCMKKLLPKDKRIKIIRKGLAIDNMHKAKIVFHHNCTTGIEAYYANLKNIFNFASQPRKGYSKEAYKKTPSIGIKKSIEFGENIVKGEIKSSLFNQGNSKTNHKNLFEIIGKKMQNNVRYKKSKHSNSENIRLKELFDNDSITNNSTKDRWRYAEKIIKKLELKKDLKHITILGNIGVLVGDWNN